MKNRQLNSINAARKVANYGTVNAAAFAGVGLSDVEATTLFTGLETDLSAVDTLLEK